MKKIKCQLCGGTWIVENFNLEKQKVCPYCLSSVQKKIEFENYDSLGKAIYGAVINNENGTLLNFRQLSGFMMDIAPNLKKEIRIFSKVMSDNHSIYIESLFSKNLDEADAIIKKLRQLFIDEDGLSETWADTICEGLHSATMYYNGIGTVEMMNVIAEDIPDFKSLTFSSPCDDKVSANKNNHDSMKIIGKETTNKSGCNTPEYNDLEVSMYSTSSIDVVSNTYNAEPFQDSLNLAKKNMDENDIDSALVAYRMAANGGYIPAYNSVASIYYKKQNFKKAWKWYLKAADANDAEGQYYVGLFYLKGLYVQKSINIAMKYFEKSSAQNYIKANIPLADLYANRNNDKKDKDRAIVLLTSAAENGYAEAQYGLGQLYQLGDIVPKDIMKAAHWYQEAVAQGYPKAKQKLNECISQMPLTQRIKWKFQ